VFFYIVFGQFSIALIFGVLAVPTAPAATIEVIRECRAEGTLCQMIIFIIALGDLLALLLFSLVINYAMPHGAWGLIALLTPLVEILISLSLGGILGYVFVRVEDLFRDETEWVILTFGSVLICTGVTSIFGLSNILANMTLGITMENLSSKEFKIFEEKLEVILMPLLIGFFVLSGAHLKIELLATVGAIMVIFVGARTAGKLLGAYGGAKLARAPPKIANNIGFSLLSQAGVALGLAYLASKQLAILGAADMGLLIFNVITAAVLIMELLGPHAVKLSLHRAKEVMLDEEICEMEP
jgi:Kef-type K+ transport system membrane component KefB